MLFKVQEERVRSERASLAHYFLLGIQIYNFLVKRKHAHCSSVEYEYRDLGQNNV